jgi:hypothetical protein
MTTTSQYSSAVLKKGDEGGEVRIQKLLNRN